MKKTAILISLALLIPAAMFADGHRGGLDARAIYDMAPGLEGQTLGEIELDDLLALGESMSIRIQEEMYVDRAAFSSLLVPGTGQFMTGDTGLGIAQFAMHLAIVGGTAVGTYLLLPEDLQNSLDNYGQTKQYFETLQYSELLPATGVFLGGMLLNGILAGWSAHGAAESARANIADGSISFEPDLRLVRGLPFIGMSMHY
jgi:TM2 domain-containing membrane protein YozV